MASTAGRKRRPLPPSLEHDLTERGFVYREAASIGRQYFIWQHKRFPTMELHVARSNIPGSEALVWEFGGDKVSFGTEEELIRRLEVTIEFRTHPNMFIEKASKS